MNVKNILLIGVLILFAGGFSFANSDGTVSIGIVTDSSQALKKSALVLLLEVELSQRVDIKLLERAEIDKILEEHRLNAAGLQDRTEIIKIGQLLRADAFIMLSLESQIEDANDLIRVRFAETAHGLRLMDYFEQSDSKNPQESVKNIVQELESVLKKINQPDEKLIPVGIVDIHRVELGEKYKMLERTLPTMLSVRLSLEPQIIMLEREDLKVLLDEKLRTQGEDSKFWNSAILIDGYLQPNNGQLELKLNLKQADGSILQSLIVPAEPNEPTISINTAVTEIIQSLQDSPPTGKWNPKLEAEQFYKQGQMLSAHGRYEEAISLFETAHALQSNNVYYIGALFESIWDIRLEVERVLVYNRLEQKYVDGLQNENSQQNQILPKFKDVPICPYSDIELTEILSIFVRQIAKGVQNDELSFQEIYDKFSRCLGREGISGLGYFSNSASVASDQIKSINEENRKIWIKTFSSAIQKSTAKYGYSQRNNTLLACLSWISSTELNELMNNLKEAITEFVMPPEYGGKVRSAEERDKIFEIAFLQEMRMISPINLEQTHLKDISEDFSLRWNQYIKEITEGENNVLGMKGQLARLQGVARLTEERDKEQIKDESIKIIEQYVEKFIASNDSLDFKAKQQYIDDIVRLTSSRSLKMSYFERKLLWEKLCRFLINKKDVDSLMAINMKISYPFGGKENKDEGILLWLYQLWDEMAEVITTLKGDPRAFNALGLIRDAQAKIKVQFPELIPSVLKTKLPVKMILTKEYWQKEMGLYDIELKEIKTKYKDEMLWIALRGSGISKNNISIGLAGIDLTNLTVKALWVAEIPYSTIGSKLTDISIGNDASFLSVSGTCIVEFPGSSKEGKEYFIDPNTIKVQNDLSPKTLLNRKAYKDGILPKALRKIRQQDTYNKPIVLTQENGLPSILITSIARNGNKLWLAYGGSGKESGLGFYDLDTSKWETVFCSTLKNELPLSNGNPYEINSMIIESGKIFLNVSELNNLKPWNPGLCKLNINTRELSFIKPLRGDFVRNLNNKLWIRSSTFFIEFDPESEAMELLIRERNEIYIKGLKSGKYVYGLKENLFFSDIFLNQVNFGPTGRGVIDLSSGTIYKGKLWVRYGQSQIIIAEKGKSLEEAEIIDNNLLDGEAVHRFVSTPYGLVGIGEGTVGLIETKE